MEAEPYFYDVEALAYKGDLLAATRKNTLMFLF
jgi:hypothetical protein